MFFKVQDRLKRLLWLDVQHPLKAATDKTQKFSEQFPDLTQQIIVLFVYYSMVKSDHIKQRSYSTQ